MESRKNKMHQESTQTLEDWLTTVCHLPAFTLQPMQGDASFRYYSRVIAAAKNYVVMNAQSETESCQPFVAIARALRNLGINTPEIFYADCASGWILMSDFGDTTYLKALNHDNVESLYSRALDVLALLQTCHPIADHSLPHFSAAFMLQEWNLHKEWFLTKFLQLPLDAVQEELDQCYQSIMDSALSQPQVLIHRDYHSANLMVLPDNEVGVLDFQDAFIGPVTYDLVSLVRDCYIDWPQDKVIQWAKRYFAKLACFDLQSLADEQTFLRWFDWMGMQRHIKALFIFARKQLRDGEPRYLRFIPRTLNYLIETSAHYSELANLHQYFKMTVQPALFTTLGSGR